LASETGTNDALHIQPGYVRFDGRISFETPDRHWAVDLIGKNLTDRVIESFIADYPTSPRQHAHKSAKCRTTLPFNLGITGR
jgi:hypothetical protein